jgi:hypothetical protein
MGTMSLDSSATSMNAVGERRPYVGWCQRSRASFEDQARLGGQDVEAGPGPVDRRPGALKVEAQQAVVVAEGVGQGRTGAEPPGDGSRRSVEDRDRPDRSIGRGRGHVLRGRAEVVGRPSGAQQRHARLERRHHGVDIGGRGDVGHRSAEGLLASDLVAQVHGDPDELGQHERQHDRRRGGDHWFVPGPGLLERGQHQQGDRQDGGDGQQAEP